MSETVGTFYGPQPKVEARKLAAGRRPHTLYLYAVEGRWEFPVDMLRYDAAWPATESDSVLIGHWMERTSGPRTVKLRSHQRPTPERWASFGWKVE